MNVINPCCEGNSAVYIHTNFVQYNEGVAGCRGEDVGSFGHLDVERGHVFGHIVGSSDSSKQSICHTHYRPPSWNKTTHLQSNREVLTNQQYVRPYNPPVPLSRVESSVEEKCSSLRHTQNTHHPTVLLSQYPTPFSLRLRIKSPKIV